MAAGSDRRPGLDRLNRGVAHRELHMVAAWSIDRLGRSLLRPTVHRAARASRDLLPKPDKSAAGPICEVRWSGRRLKKFQASDQACRPAEDLHLWRLRRVDHPAWRSSRLATQAATMARSHASVIPVFAANQRVRSGTLRHEFCVTGGTGRWPRVRVPKDKPPGGCVHEWEAGMAVVDRRAKIGLPIEVDALRSALAAWDRAVVSPSKWGLPTAAAVAAYSAILPKPAEAIRAMLVAALEARAARAGQTVH
jgi:hypothetical protein